MNKVIICRFSCEEDFIDFKNKNNLNIDPNTKEYNVRTGEKKNKRIVKSKVTVNKDWETHWVGMPEFTSKKQEVYSLINFIFDNENYHLATEMFNQGMTDKTQSVWYPKLIAGTYAKKRAIGGESNNKYPIYVISKGRANICYTSIFLTQMEVNHYIVVEPQEVKEYKIYNTNQFANIIEMNMSYKDNYDTFDDLGDSKPKGPGSARNFAWEHSIKNNYKKHWVFDDNANEGFHYLYKNEKIKCRTGAIFRACEDFIDRYNNVPLSGLNYSKFCKMSDELPAYVMNTRIYSFLLIDNSLPYRWRGRYNEDTDLSLRVLKDGYCTLQFNVFLAGKATTQKIKGGNTDEFYSQEGTLPKSKMLEEMHPDVSKVVWKFQRWHHEVNYKGFTQKLEYKNEYKNYVFEDNNYGIKVLDTEEISVNDTKTYLENKYKF